MSARSEATYAPAPAPHADPTFGTATTGKVGMWIFLVTDAMTFGGLLLAYGILRAGNKGWPAPTSVLGIPFTAVNHMEGHLYSVFLEADVPAYPFLALVVSGGHTMLVHVEAPFRHVVLGETRDDAAGEAFDKVAKMLGLGYPGGPAIDRLGAEGDPGAVRFPRSFLEEGTLDFSFSGIKTSVLYYLRREGLGESGGASTLLDRKRMADICASFQAAIVDVLVARTMDAALRLGLTDIALAGGVSANSSLRRTLRDEAEKRGYRVFTPRSEYCMDNGAMIAYAGWMRLVRGLTSAFDTPAVAYLEMTGTPS